MYYNLLNDLLDYVANGKANEWINYVIDPVFIMY